MSAGLKTQPVQSSNHRSNIDVLKANLATSLKNTSFKDVKALRKHVSDFLKENAGSVKNLYVINEPATSARHKDIYQSAVQSGNTRILNTIDPNAVPMANAAIKKNEAVENQKRPTNHPTNGIFNQLTPTPK